MRPLLQRLPLLGAIQVVLPLTLLLFVLGSGSVLRLMTDGLRFRWVGLLAMFCLAIALVAARGSWRVPPYLVYRLIAAFALLSVASVTWSVDTRLSFERAGSFLILLGAVCALSLALRDDLEGLVRVLTSLVAGVVFISLAGVVVWLFSHADAVQGATPGTPMRWKGLGQNPNTVSMLAAIALPLALALALRRDGRPRLFDWVALAALGGTVVASASRGAIVAAVGGMFVATVGAHGLSRRAVIWASILVVGISGAVVTNVVLPTTPIVTSAVPVGQTSSTNPGTHTSTSKTSKGGPTSTSKTSKGGSAHTSGSTSSGHSSTAVSLGAEGTIPPLSDEIGFGDNQPRALFGTSGRSIAWQGAIDEGRKQPLLGFGFGTEAKVFVDRYYYFFGDLPENSYIGLFLELGVVGLLIFLGIGISLLGLLLRGARLGGPERWMVFGAGGAALAGFLLAVGQSYVYSVGNVATLSFWLSCLMLVAAAHIRQDRTSGAP